MRYVLDASVAVKWRLPEPDSDRALVLKTDYVNQLHELLAPDVFPIEIAHAFSRAERRGILRPPEGGQALTDILQLLPQLHDSLALLPRAFEISTSVRLGVYDCLYLALAEREQAPLVTADRRLLSLGFPATDLATF